MKRKKLVLFLSIVIATLILTNIKINKNKDLIWHLEENLHSKIIFTIKKIYIFYTHEIRNTIILEKKLTDEDVNSMEKNYKLNTFSNKFFKKNGPKAFIEIDDNKLISITGTGVMSFANLSDFKKDKVSLKIIRNNLRNIIRSSKIVENPVLILNMLVANKKVFVSYVKEKEKDCFSTIVLMADIDFKRMNFEKIFDPNSCVKKDNSYGEFEMLEAAGALEMLDEKNLLLSTGAFRFRDHSQNKDNVYGKILLLNINDKKYKIISIGHRNSQGIYYDKKKDIIFSTDHGPQGGDEINITYNPLDNKIKNFGWPVSSYGEHYGGRIKKNIVKYKKAPFYKSHTKYGFIEPHKYFVPSIAPSNIIQVPAKFNKKDHDQIFVSSLGWDNTIGKRSIHSFSYNKDKKLDSHEIIPLKERVRDIHYIDHLNSVFLFLENSGSFGILKLK
jgi:hypothetical protein